MKRDFNFSRLRLAAAAVVTASLALVACSGDDDGMYAPIPPVTTVPASAGASVATFVAYIQTLAVDETGEPLGLADITPPTDDTIEPTAL